jgi:hypothetical protein
MCHGVDYRKRFFVTNRLRIDALRKQLFGHGPFTFNMVANDLFVLGWSGWLAGGDVEKSARSVRRFVAAEIFSGGRVIRSLSTSLPPSRCSQLGGAAVRLLSAPETVGGGFGC